MAVQYRRSEVVFEFVLGFDYRRWKTHGACGRLTILKLGCAAFVDADEHDDRAVGAAHKVRMRAANARDGHEPHHGFFDRWWARSSGNPISHLERQSALELRCGELVQTIEIDDSDWQILWRRLAVRIAA